MPIGQTVPNFSSTKNFPLLGTVYSEDLHVKVELGRLFIPPRNSFLEGRVVMNTIDNPYHPNPGGEQAKSFVNNSIRESFSDSLNKNTNGAMKPHIPISGSPYCTFLGVSMAPGETHPLYDLIKAPDDLPNVTFNGAKTFNTNQVLINYNFNVGISSQFIQFGKLGDLAIPATTKTNQAVADLKLPTLTSYNFWSVDNISSQYFNVIKYLGYVEKNNIQITNSNPYAVVTSNVETAEIQAWASNSTISLTRMYPLYKDIAHDPNASYYFYDSAFTNTPQLQVNPIGLYNTGTPVGFVINFSTITPPTFDPTYVNTESGTFIKEPALYVHWGDLDFITDAGVRDSYTKQNKVGLYSFIWQWGEKPRIYFNLTESEIQGGQVSPNKNNIVLSTFDPLDKASSLALHVFYSGQYMYVGNSSNTGKWENLGAPLIGYKNDAPTNIPSGVNTPRNSYLHWLDEKSKVRITAWFLDFTFSYGPPLFTPLDRKNIPIETNISPVTGTNYYASQNLIPTTSIPDASTAQDIQDSILKYALPTFVDPSADPDRYVGGATIYNDIRAVDSTFLVDTATADQPDGFSFFTCKITYPTDLGGHVLNKYYPDKLDIEPTISESYVKYDMEFWEGSTSSLSISEILSQSVGKLSIMKDVDPNTAASLKTTLKINFLNLNKDDNSFNVMQYIRRNVAVLRVSAGYGDDMHIYFEGVVEDNSLTESLDGTVFEVTAVDLLQWLFIEKESLIVHRGSGMSFPGMRYYDMINSLVERTELRNHFQYDLGDRTLPSTIMYKLVQTGQEAIGLPKVLDSMLVPDLAMLRIIPYSQDSTYFAVLQKICQLLLQYEAKLVTDTKGKKPLVDAPILYWSAEMKPSSGAVMIGSGNTVVDPSVDGIIMSSRSQPKDEDLFYFRKRNISLGLTSSIQELHGYIVGSEGGVSFQSDSNSKLLYRQGIYYFQDEQQNQYQVAAPSTLASGTPDQRPLGPVDVDYADAPKIGDPNSPYLSNAYIGYDKLVVYSNEDKEGSSFQLSQLILPDKSNAQRIIDNFYYVFNNNVYENINLSAYVTKPLKAWGHFKICVEDDSNPINENYMYISIDYDFKLFENVIEAKVKAAKKPILS